MTFGVPGEISRSARRMGRADAMIDLARNLWAGTRLACFGPVERQSFRISINQAVLLIAIAEGIHLAMAYVTTPAPRQFSEYGLAHGGLMLLAFLFACYAVSFAARSSDLFLPLVVVMMSTQPVFVILSQVLKVEQAQLPAGEMWTEVERWLPFAWALVIAFRGLRLLHRPRLLWLGALLAVYCGIQVTPQLALFRLELWYTARPETAEAERPRVNVEDTYYQQPKLVRRALDQVSAGRPGVTDLFFVGFAGDGDEDVFMLEVLTAAELLGERFDSAGRSLLLINNPETVEELPLANTANLRAVLPEIAARMNLDEDVLFLFLTSHGSNNHWLSTRFQYLQMNPLDGEALRGILDEAGIRWRVIVISACYSGSFIPLLENEHTLVITAARHDRTSFGCGAGRLLTYFGKAYFDEALRERLSFIEAFRLAQESIVARETEEKLTPSRPQIRIGERIEAKLKELEQRLSGIAPGEASSPVTTP